jgi:Ca2+/Na+ antiporter
MIYLIVSSIHTDNDENEKYYFWVIIKEVKNKEKEKDEENNIRETDEENNKKDKDEENKINIIEKDIVSTIDFNMQKQILNKIKENSEKKMDKEKEKDHEKEKEKDKENDVKNFYNYHSVSFEDISNISIHHLRKLLNEKKENQKNNYTIKEEDKKLIKNEINIEKYDYMRHSYIKNISLKINSYESFIHLFLNGIKKILTKPWELLVDSLVPKSNEGFSLIFSFLIQMCLIWNFSELEIYLLEKVVSRLNIPPSFLGLTIMSWGNNAPDM